jgi:hypothetical protein
VHDLRPGKPSESKLDGSEGNEGGQSFGKVLEVLGETPVASEPGESALDHPAARQDDKALPVVAPLYDPHAQPRYFCYRSFNLPRVVAIGPDQFEPREATAHFAEDLSANAKEIEGSWQIPGGWSGRFLMIRSNGTEESIAREVSQFV